MSIFTFALTFLPKGIAAEKPAKVLHDSFEGTTANGNPAFKED